jgi:hypothetical protein
MNLNPQDVVVALKLFGYPNGRPAMSIVASDLGLSPSEVHGAIQRLRSSKLLQGSALQDKPNISGLVEFLVHGLKYAFPAEHGEVTRGVATSYAAEPLKVKLPSRVTCRQSGPGAKAKLGAWVLNPFTKACRMPHCVIPRCTNFSRWSTPFEMGARASGIWPNAIGAQAESRSWPILIFNC